MFNEIEAILEKTYKNENKWENPFSLFIKDFITLSKKEFKAKFPELKYKKIKKWILSEEKNPFFQERDDTQPFEHIKSKMEEEGIGYYILNYTDGLVESPTMKALYLFKKAELALEEYRTYIEKEYEKEEGECNDFC